MRSRPCCGRAASGWAPTSSGQPWSTSSTISAWSPRSGSERWCWSASGSRSAAAAGGGPPGTLSALELGLCPVNRLRRGSGRADLELDVGMADERDVPDALGPQLAVHEGGDLALRRPHFGRAERLVPFVEEVAQGVDPPRRGLDVDDPVGSVGVQPVDALAAGGDRAAGGLILDRAGNPDAPGDRVLLAVDEHGQVGMDRSEGAHV